MYLLCNACLVCYFLGLEKMNLSVLYGNLDAAEAPVIVNVTETPKVGQELQVTCMGNVGRLQGQPQHDLRVQIMFAVRIRLTL